MFFYIVLSFLVQLCSSLLLPAPGGKYDVSLNISQLIDTKRSDPYAPQPTFRKVMISRFDPVQPHTCDTTITIPYMPAPVASWEDSILYPQGYPAGLLGNVSFMVCSHLKAQSRYFDPTFVAPIILFSPGLNISRLRYNALALEVASQGYTVITIDHPYDADIVQFPDGSVIYAKVIPDNQTLAEQLAEGVQAVAVRSGDISFVLDTLGFTTAPSSQKAIVFGHSLGGDAAAATMLSDPRIKGGVNLDGTMLPPVIFSGLNPLINQSFILWGSTNPLHSSSTDATWGAFYAAISAEDIWRRELSLIGSVHLSFTDLAHIADVAGVRGSLSAAAQLALTGYLDGARVLSILGQYLDSYFQFVLNRDVGEGLLGKKNGRFPEVVFVGSGE